MNFNSKETYLAAVANWKLQYAEVITKIRKNKNDFKNAAREFSKVDFYPVWKGSDEQRKAYYDAHVVMENFRSHHHALVLEVTSLIVERAEGREEAGRQMQKRLNART